MTSEAWLISKGCNSNVIAVLDDGFDINHEDLINRFYRDGNNNIIGNDFTSQGDNSPLPSKNNPHGTSCSGIIAAATNNNIGVSGYDWNCNIMPLQITYSDIDIDLWPGQGNNWSPSWTASAIGYAKNNNASVLSMSFSQIESSQITSAIQNAATNGRNGKGCIICVSSGNENSGAVAYPASLDQYVMAVGATDQNDVKWNYSNYGPELDVVAPSGLCAGVEQVTNIPEDCGGYQGKYRYVITMQGNIWTTDLTGYDNDTGDFGYHDDNCYYKNVLSPSGYDTKYTALFSGTSAAAPQVAGLSSLILSINQNLTRVQVQNILQNSADKVAGMNGQVRTNEYGYGRINAFKALKYTIENYETVNLVSGTISTNTTWSGYKYVVDNVTVNSGVTLTLEPGISLLFKNGKGITVNGTLSANGAQENQIYFTAINQNPVSGSWSGIKIYGNATINYCNVKYADKGVHFNTSATGTISNSTLQNNNYGIYSYQSSPNIQNCQIHHNSYGGISFSSANNPGAAQILDNSIYENQYGIYLQLSSPDIRSNQIYNNYHGVFCISSSSPHLGEIGYYGYNNIHDNQYGLRANSSCNPQLGENGCQVNGGWNQIVNSASYLVWANYNSNVRAEDNWWGSAPPLSSKFFCGTGSAIDTVPYLPYQPTMGLMAGGSPEEQAFDEAFGSNAAQDNVSAQGNYDEKWPLSQKLDYARSIIYLGDIPFAEKICKDVIETCPDSVLSFFALDILWEASRHEKAAVGCDLISFKSYLQDLTQIKEKKELYGYSKIILADFDNKNSVNYFDQVYSDYHKTFLAQVALYHKFLYYYN